MVAVQGVVHLFVDGDDAFARLPVLVQRELHLASATAGARWAATWAV
jgi:hypothetical protein